MAETTTTGRQVLAFVAGLIGAVILATLLFLVLHAAGVEHAGFIGGGIVVVAAVGYLFYLGSRQRSA